LANASVRFSKIRITIAYGNDRQKLLENDRSSALLEWVREQVEALAEKMETKIQQERKAQDLKNTSALNEMLNRWKDRFMNQVWIEMFAGQGPAGAGGSEKGTGTGGKGDGKNTGGGNARYRRPRGRQREDA
jgi:hypothetical protein